MWFNRQSLGEHINETDQNELFTFYEVLKYFTILVFGT